MHKYVVSGFSLLEMLVVVAILAIVSVLAAPLLSSTAPQKLNVAAEETANLLRFALSEARRTGGYVLVDGKTVAGQLQLFSSTSSAQQPPVSGTSIIADPLTKRAAVLTVSGNPFSQGVTLTPQFRAGGSAQPQLLIGPGTTQLQGFNAAGVSQGALQANSTVLLTFGSQTATVSISHVTGLVTTP
jgi:prepilin-type N-terminal cleavage/methylation domain-containing protein